MKTFLLYFAFICAIVHGADSPKIIYKEGKQLAGFDLQQGKLPCKKGSPCLFFHKDNDNLRLIIEGKNIRMAYKSEDKESLPFPKNFKLMDIEEKNELIESYIAFFKSEFALMLQAFVYTVPEIFDWSVDKFKAAQGKHLISEPMLRGIFASSKPPELYSVFKIKCRDGETLVFESDGSGSFFMEVE